MVPTADFDWEMPSRALGWINAWDETSSTYAQDYVSPRQWRVTLDTKRSDGNGSLIERYRWVIKGLDGNSFSLVDEDIPSSPRTRFTKLLPQLGRYQVTLTIINKRGEQSVPFSRAINLQDLLIVSLGDSMASGEGNPDKAGETVLDLEGIFPDDPHWTDQRCHRSRRAGHARAALQLEWQKRSVTFLSFACSGAGIQSGLLGRFDGMKPPATPHDKLQSQIEAALSAIGKRTIDVLLITVGINDLGLGSDGFSSVIKAFAGPGDFGDGDVKREVSEKLKTMPNKYSRVAWALSRVLHNRVKRIYVTEYPYHIFQGTGCEALFMITLAEDGFLFEKGKELTDVLQNTVTRHRWNFVGGIEARFRGHGYCSSEHWYVRLLESIVQQENIDGTIHPNGLGHKAIAERIVDTVNRPVRDRAFRPKQVRVVFESVKVVVPAGTDAGQARNITLGANGQENSTGPVLFNREINLPEHFAYSFFVDDRLSGPFVEVTGLASLPKLNPDDPSSSPEVIDFLDQFGSAENYGEGPHFTRKKNLEVHYRIEIIDKVPVGPKQVTITFEKIKVKVPPAVGAAQAKHIVLVADVQRHSIGPVLLNQEITLAKQDFSFTFIVDPGLPGRMVEVKGIASIPNPKPENPDSHPITLDFAEKFGSDRHFGEGSHEFSDSNFDVQYRIEVRNAPSSGGSPFEPIPSSSQKPTTDVRVTVRFEKLRVNFQADATKTVRPVDIFVNGVKRSIGPVALNRDISLPESDFTLSFIVDNGQASPFIEISAETELPKSSPEDPDAKPRAVELINRFGRVQNFGAGSHVGKIKELEVHYTITTESIGGPPAGDTV